MEIIPLISLRKRRFWSEQGDHTLTLQEIRKKIPSEQKIYLIDHDGLDKNKPNLNYMQELAGPYLVWADTGPRSIGDVVDTVFAGATKITLRNTLWPDFDPPTLKEMTESELYIAIDLLHTTHTDLNTSVFFNIDGITILNTKEQVEKNFTIGSRLKDLTRTHKLYAFEPNPEHTLFWKEKGITGLLTDIDTIQEA